MNMNILKQIRYFTLQHLFSYFLPNYGSVHGPKHVAQSDQYMKSGVIDGCFSYL
jgi:hypothetical protein